MTRRNQYQKYFLVLKSSLTLKANIAFAFKLPAALTFSDVRRRTLWLDSLQYLVARNMIPCSTWKNKVFIPSSYLSAQTSLIQQFNFPLLLNQFSATLSTAPVPYSTIPIYTPTFLLCFEVPIYSVQVWYLKLSTKPMIDLSPPAKTGFCPIMSVRNSTTHKDQSLKQCKCISHK